MKEKRLTGIGIKRKGDKSFKVSGDFSTGEKAKPVLTMYNYMVVNSSPKR